MHRDRPGDIENLVENEKRSLSSPLIVALSVAFAVGGFCCTYDHRTSVGIDRKRLEVR